VRKLQTHALKRVGNRFAVTWQYFGCQSYKYECSGPSVWTAGCSVVRNQTEGQKTTSEKII